MKSASFKFTLSKRVRFPLAYMQVSLVFLSVESHTKL